MEKQGSVNGLGSNGLSSPSRIVRRDRGGAGDRRGGIAFEPSVVLLEAAARNDLEEGRYFSYKPTTCGIRLTYTKTP